MLERERKRKDALYTYKCCLHCIASELERPTHNGQQVRPNPGDERLRPIPAANALEIREWIKACRRGSKHL